MINNYNGHTPLKKGFSFFFVKKTFFFKISKKAWTRWTQWTQAYKRKIINVL